MRQRASPRLGATRDRAQYPSGIKSTALAADLLETLTANATRRWGQERATALAEALASVEPALAAELGSFTAAAAELGVSQAAVSQRVAQLEMEMGVSLFSRRAGRDSRSRR